MWIFMNDSFLSIVQDRNNDAQFLVRGRAEGDVKRIFPDFEEIETTDSDYRYRAFVPKDYVVETIARKVEKIDYPNFKNSVKSKLRSIAYSKVWEVMFNFQHYLNMPKKR